MEKNLKFVDSVFHTAIYKSLRLFPSINHAYIFYSNDEFLNNFIAYAFAKQLLCERETLCGQCASCKQVNTLSHPDLYILDSETIKVEDVEKLMGKLSTKPVFSDKKVFVIINFDKANEIAQNKLLKTFEEPNASNVFILSSTKPNKILNTILSRLKKVYLPKLSTEDALIIKDELKSKGIDIVKFIDHDYSLTEMIMNSSNSAFLDTISAIKGIFNELNSSSDIPRVVSKMANFDKTIFFSLLQEIFLNCLKDDQKKFDNELISIIKLRLSNKAIIRSLPLIEDAHKKLMANVNFSYILDNLLFNILKEKYLCN